MNSEQVSFNEVMTKSVNCSTSSKKKSPTKKKALIPDELLKIGDLKSCDMETVIRKLGFDHLSFSRGSAYYYGRGGVDCEYGLFENTAISLPLTGKGKSLIVVSSNKGEYVAKPVFVDSDGTPWILNITITKEGCEYKTEYGANFRETKHYWSDGVISSIEIGKWRKGKLEKYLSPMQNESELAELLKSLNIYAYNFWKDKSVGIIAAFLAPQLEILDKAGYAFAEYFLNRKLSVLEDSRIDCFNRLTQRGSNPKEILKTSKAVYTTLKNETSMKVWDSFRKLDKMGRVSPDSIQTVYDLHYSDKDLDYIYKILSVKYDDKQVFTHDKLISYVQRVDMNEAIPRAECFNLLTDYLRMCQQLNIKPVLDGDSLKREHDTTARTLRESKNDKFKDTMLPVCNDMSIYDYSEGVYMIRAIRNWEDLIDEACGQHSCVASYASLISERNAFIYVMREVSNPDESLITVELSKDQKSIRQKLMSYNRPIRNKSMTEFLERWIKWVRSQPNKIPV